MQVTENKIIQSGTEFHGETLPAVYEYDSSNPFKEGVGYHPIDNTDLFSENSGKIVTPSTFSSIYQFYEAKMAALIRKNGVLEGQLAAAMASREAVEKNLSSALKIRQEMEKRIADMVKEMEMLRDKLAGVEIAKEEANSLSNIVHSDNVRLEHDVAFLKAVLDDTQKVLTCLVDGRVVSCIPMNLITMNLKYWTLIFGCRNFTLREGSLLEKGLGLFNYRYSTKLELLSLFPLNFIPADTVPRQVTTLHGLIFIGPSIYHLRLGLLGYLITFTRLVFIS